MSSDKSKEHARQNQHRRQAAVWSNRPSPRPPPRVRIRSF